MKKLLFIFSFLLTFIIIDGQGLLPGVVSSQSVASQGASGGAAYTDDFESYTADGPTYLGGQGLRKDIVANSFGVQTVSGDKCAKQVSVSNGAIAYDNTVADNQYATITYNSGAGGYIGPAVRLGADASGNGYISFGGSSGLYLRRIDAASSTSLAGGETNGLSDGDVVKITANGTTIKVYVNDVEKLSVTDATYSSGRTGMGVFPNGDAFAESWTGGDL